MLWTKVFNNELKKIKNKLYEECSEIFELTERINKDRVDKITESYILYNRFLGENVNLTIEDIEEDVTKDLNEISKKWDEGIVELNKRVDIFIDNLERDLLEISKKSAYHLKSDKERNKLLYRAKLVRYEIGVQIYQYIELQRLEYVDIANNNMLIEDNKYNYKIKNENELYTDCEVEIKENKYRIEKIFDYKEMERLAENNGYNYKWSNGSHRVYEHSESKKIIVIPSHDLGYGLSRKIQKQIYTNIA